MLRKSDFLPSKQNDTEEQLLENQVEKSTTVVIKEIVIKLNLRRAEHQSHW